MRLPVALEERRGLLRRLIVDEPEGCRDGEPRQGRREGGGSGQMTAGGEAEPVAIAVMLEGLVGAARLVRAVGMRIRPADDVLSEWIAQAERGQMEEGRQNALQDEEKRQDERQRRGAVIPCLAHFPFHAAVIRRGHRFGQSAPACRRQGDDAACAEPQRRLSPIRA